MSTARFERLEARRLLAIAGLDLPFGHAGLASLPESYDAELAVARTLPDGKILAAGLGTDPSTHYLVGGAPLVARFNSNGTLDTSFDGDGVLLLAKSGEADAITYAAGEFQPDGKLILVRTTYGRAPVEFYRFNPDGTVDASFGQNGIAVYTFGSFDDVRPSHLAVQPDGKIVFSFSVQGKMCLGRLNANGSVDAGFVGGKPGSMPTEMSSGLGQILIGPDGKIYVTGIVQKRKKYEYDAGVVTRFNPDGTLDTSYGGGDGYAEIVNTIGAGTIDGNLDAPEATTRSLRFDREGRLLVISRFSYYDRRQYRPYESLHLTWLTTAGALDKTFGEGDGDYTISDEKDAIDYGVTVDRKGRINGAYRAGAMYGTTNAGAVFQYRLRSDGTADTSFSPSGQLFPPQPYDARWTWEPSGTVLEIRGPSVARFVGNPTPVYLDQDGELFIRGTEQADSVTVERSNDQIIVSLNGKTTSVAAAGVKQVIMHTGGGGDVVKVSLDINTSIVSGTGNDTITAAGGDATIEGELGNDKIFCGDGNYRASGGWGRDYVTTGAGRDLVEGETVSSGAGNDTIHGGGASDSINAGSGNDIIYTGDGNDTVHGGTGNDLIQDFKEPESVGEINYVSNVGKGTGRKHYYGDDGNDALFGSVGNDIIFGNGGRDFIFGRAANDSISGGGGRDEIYGAERQDEELRSGNNQQDTLQGGEDADTLNGSYGNDTISGDAGSDLIITWGGNDLVSGGSGNDNITGADQDTLYGDAGDDRITGGVKNQLIRGGSGNDTLRGNGGEDTIHGDDGNDVIFSKDGEKESIFGGDGRDSLESDKDDVLSEIEVKG
ncbi:MAG TPA: hypothetical protein VF669_03755 [Tepidisphaeraceae bacterium]|jgi:uncharacterized delta-60 repeat protein